MTEKTPIVPGRVRRPPASGWSWVDRSFLRLHAPALTSRAILLYLFWAAVADRKGLSYWGDGAVAARLHMAEDDVARGREELVLRDLVAYRRPLTQVLSLPSRALDVRAREPATVGGILRDIALGIGPGRAERSPSWK